MRPRPTAGRVGRLGQPVDDGVEDETASRGPAGADGEGAVEESSSRRARPGRRPAAARPPARAGRTAAAATRSPSAVATIGRQAGRGRARVQAIDSQPRTRALSVPAPAVPARPRGEVLVPAQHGRPPLRGPGLLAPGSTAGTVGGVRRTLPSPPPAGPRGGVPVVVAVASLAAVLVSRAAAAGGRAGVPGAARTGAARARLRRVDGVAPGAGRPADRIGAGRHRGAACRARGPAISRMRPARSVTPSTPRWPGPARRASTSSAIRRAASRRGCGWPTAGPTSRGGW